MADFGSNFTEAFAATYGLGLKRKQVEGEEKRANAQEARAQESHDAQMNEYRLKDEMRTRLGAAGNTLDNPNDQSGLLTADAYKGLTTTKPTAALPTANSKAVTAPTLDTTKQPTVKNEDGTQSTVSTMGFDIDGKYVNLPTISPEGARLTPAQAVEQYRKTGKHLGIFNNRAEGDAAAQETHLSEEKRISALPQTGVSQAETPQPSANDYVPVQVGNSVMYAPSARVKKLQGPELIRAQAAAIGSIDPAVGAQLLQSANAIEGQNLELNSKRYAQGVLNAARTAENDFDAGLGMLRDAYNQNMPDLGNVEFTRQKDGGIKVDNYVDTAGGRKLLSSRTLPAKDSKTGLTAKESLFSYALSLGSPDAYRQNIIDSSTLASQELQRMLSIKEDKRQDAELGLRRVEVGLRAREIKALQNNPKVNFAEDPVSYTNAQGQSMQLPRYRVQEKNTKEFAYVYPNVLGPDGSPAQLRPEYGSDAVAVNNFMTRAKTLKWDVTGEADGRIYFRPNKRSNLKQLPLGALKEYGNRGRLYNDK